MFLVLGPRPGELFAFRRNDRVGHNYIRLDEAISPLVGIVEPKSDSSKAFIWMPQSLGIELDFWMEAQQDKRPEAFLFATRKGTPLSANNFLKRQLKRAGENVRKKLEEQGATLSSGFLEGLTHQALRRSCATHMQPYGSVKDIQAHLRHARPNITADAYMQKIPARVLAAVEVLDQKLTSVRKVISPIEHRFGKRGG
jgi:integrase